MIDAQLAHVAAEGWQRAAERLLDQRGQLLALHDAWADMPTEELDPVVMWEEIGRALEVLR